MNFSNPPHKFSSLNRRVISRVDNSARRSLMRGGLQQRGPKLDFSLIRRESAEFFRDVKILKAYKRIDKELNL